MTIQNKAKAAIKKYQEPADKLSIGGYSTDSEDKRLSIYRSYDPTGGTGISQLLYMMLGGNQAKGEENEYWKAYLGLDNSVPKMNQTAKTEWDDAIEKSKLELGEMPSDFYGTTARMDANIQAIADTLNTGKILRDYAAFKKAHPDLPPKSTIKAMYESGKKVMDNPNEWVQVDGDRAALKSKYDETTNETNPLGMLAKFGMKWNPSKNTLHIHDTYDFGTLGKWMVGNRPKEMKIRGKINFNPNNGSILLRDNLAQYNSGYPDPITK